MADTILADTISTDATLAEPVKLRTQWTGGRLLHIHIAPAASFEMEEIEEANCIAGRGIEGDRYFLGTGTYSPKPDAREVTLFEMEVSMLFAAMTRRCKTARSNSNRAIIAGTSPSWACRSITSSASGFASATSF